MDTGLIYDFKRFSIHDGPGIRTTVFFKGCPLRCWWCHNPESQSPRRELVIRPHLCIACHACLQACPTGSLAVRDGMLVTGRDTCQVCGTCAEICYAGTREIAGQEMTVAQVMDEVTRDRTFFDTSGGGVTFSGGEPLRQPAFLVALLQACQHAGLHTVVDTCGYAAWDDLEQVAHHTDLFLYDLKLMDEDRHRSVTGVSNRRILENLQSLVQDGHRVHLRIPVIPGLNDDMENLEAAGAFLDSLPGLEGIELLPYHQIGRQKYARLDRECHLPPTDPPTEPQLRAMAMNLRRHGLTVQIGG